MPATNNPRGVPRLHRTIPSPAQAPAVFLRGGLWFALCMALCLSSVQAPGAAHADPMPALRAAPEDMVEPGDPAWPLAVRVEHGARVGVSRDAEVRAPGGLPVFRVELSPLPGGKEVSPRACVGLSSAERRNLYKTRAIELYVKASKPVPGFITITSSNTENPAARDRFFGSFVIGAGWKALRLRYGDLAPLPGWPAEALRQGYSPGDLVLRPDSVEDICIGAESGRLPEEGVTIFLGGVRFVR
jgi:hypothetical protein